MRRFIRNLTLLLFHTLMFAAARTAAAEELNVYVDRSDPLIAVSRTSLDGNRLVVTGTAYDAWSGVKSVEASADGEPFEHVGEFVSGSGGEWTYVYSVSEASDRYGRFVFRATDNAGNTAEIVRNDIEIYNKKAALIFPDYIVKGLKYVPEIQGEPVKAVVTVSGKGHDYEEWELSGPDFILSWAGMIAGNEVPQGNYLTTVRTYNMTGQFTVSNMQAIVPGEETGTGGNETRTIDTEISGVVDDISGNGAVIDGREFEITDSSQIDDSIKPGSSVSGIGWYDTYTGETEIIVLVNTDSAERNLPDIEIEGDRKLGEEDFSGIVEAVGGDYIVVDGEVIFITDKTEMNCAFNDVKPGDYVSGRAEIFSLSGTKALVLNRADHEKAGTVILTGHVTDMGDGWVEIDTGEGRYIVTDDTVVDGTYDIGTLIRMEILLPDNEALRIRVLQHAQCSDGLSYYYGEIHGIFKETGELVLDDFIHTFDRSMLADETAGMPEPGAVAALVDYDCRSFSLRVVQNAGDPREEDRIIGTVTETGSKDINGNTPLYIDGKYHFVSGNTDIRTKFEPGSPVITVQSGEELIYVTEIPGAVIDTDSLIDFAGTAARVSGTDSYGRRYVLVNGVTYRIFPDSYIDETIGTLEKGAVIAGTSDGNLILHAAVIKAKAEDVNPENAFIGTINENTLTDHDEFPVIINGKRYLADSGTLNYSGLHESDTVMAVHDGGRLLLIRDYPGNVSDSRPAAEFGVIENVSAKDYEGNYTVAVNGYSYRVTGETHTSGYIAAGMKCLICYIEDAEGIRELKSVAVGNLNDEISRPVAVTGKIGAVGVPDESGSGRMLIDGFSYVYTADTAMTPLSRGDFVIAAVRDGVILSAADAGDEMIYEKSEPFSGLIEAVSDMQTDGSYIVKVGGTEISLTEDTLLNDSEASVQPDTVMAGIRFGRTVWAAATYGIDRMDVSDVAFSGVIEDIDVGKHTVTVRGHERNMGNINLSGFSVGMVVVGAMRPGKNAVSVKVIDPEITADDIFSFGGTIESISATDKDGVRKMTVNGDVYLIPGSAFVSGELKDGTRIAGFALNYSNEVIVVSVAEAQDLGGYMEGRIDEITSEHVSRSDKPDWYHLILGGIADLVSDKTAVISQELRVKDKVSGYHFGPERKLLAVLEEDTSLLGRFRNASAAVKVGTGGLALVVIGSGLGLVVGGRKRRFSGILELDSDTSIIVRNPESSSDMKRYKLPKNLYETASLLNHKDVKGYISFGKITDLDLN